MKRLTIILCALLCMASRHPDRMVRGDLVLNASFNRGDASDRSMYGHAPTLANGAVVTAGNRYLTVDGVNDFLSYPDHASFSCTDGAGNDRAFSISAWVYLDASANAFKTIAGKVESSSPARSEWVFYASGNAASFKGPAFSIFSSDLSQNIFAAVNANVVPATTWTHICATYSGSETAAGIEVYVNGVASADVRVASASYVGCSDTSAKVTVGSRELSGFYLGGRIDDKRIYNRALTANEVAAIYSEGHP